MLENLRVSFINDEWILAIWQHGSGKSKELMCRVGKMNTRRMDFSSFERNTKIEWIGSEHRFETGTSPSMFCTTWQEGQLNPPYVVCAFEGVGDSHNLK